MFCLGELLALFSPAFIRIKTSSLKIFFFIFLMFTELKEMRTHVDLRLGWGGSRNGGKADETTVSNLLLRYPRPLTQESFLLI